MPSEEDFSDLDRNELNNVFNSRCLKIHENHWPIKNAESIKRNSSDEENKQKIQIKVFKREKNKGSFALTVANASNKRTRTIIISDGKLEIEPFNSDCNFYSIELFFIHRHTCHELYN